MNIADIYDPDLNQNAGFLLDSPDPSKPIGDDGKRLLHLIYWLTYTREGRQFLTSNKPSKVSPLPADRKSDQAVRDALRAKFTADFKLDTDENIMEACIQLHFQATFWVDENKKVIAGDASAVAARALHESNYKMYLSVITWQLWIDGIGHEFSLGW